MFVAPYPYWVATVLWRDGKAVHFDGAKDFFKYLLDLKKYEPGRSRRHQQAMGVTDYYATGASTRRRLGTWSARTCWGRWGTNWCRTTAGRRSARVHGRPQGPARAALCRSHASAAGRWTTASSAMKDQRNPAGHAGPAWPARAGHPGPGRRACCCWRVWLARPCTAWAQRQAAPGPRPVSGWCRANCSLTDLAWFTEARYTRHLSQADLHSAFQDGPGALEHFPGRLAGAARTAPRHRVFLGNALADSHQNAPSCNSHARRGMILHLSHATPGWPPTLPGGLRRGRHGAPARAPTSGLWLVYTLLILRAGLGDAAGQRAAARGRGQCCRTRPTWWLQGLRMGRHEMSRAPTSRSCAACAVHPARAGPAVGLSVRHRQRRQLHAAGAASARRRSTWRCQDGEVDASAKAWRGCAKLQVGAPDVPGVAQRRAF
jgi:hypothetical protein